MRSGASSSHLATSMLSYSHFSLAPISRWLQIFEFILALRLQWHVNASAQLQRGRGPDCAKTANCHTRTCLIFANCVSPSGVFFTSFSVTSTIPPSATRSSLFTYIPKTRTAIRSHGTTVRQRVGLICLNESRSFCALCCLFPLHAVLYAVLAPCRTAT